MAVWNIIMARGATYEETITLTGVTDISSATEWKVRFAQSDGAAFLTASIANNMIVDVSPPVVGKKLLRIPAATTATLPIGNARFDFEVEWSGGTTVRRYVSGADAQVNPKVGA